MRSFTFEAIGTHWQIDIIDPGDFSFLLEKIKARIAEFDKNYSRFRPDSLVSTMARAAGEYTLPADAPPLFDTYQKLYRLTDGAVTPLIGQVMVEAGYDADYSLVPHELHHPPAWEEVIEYQFPRLTLKQPALLDFGAAGKGYLIDLVAEVLAAEGVTAYCIDAGADILYHHTKPEPLRVGLEDPNDSAQVVGVANILNNSICGSAGNRRTWADFHHIVDPHTLTSPRHILATWAIAPAGLLADALATALFFVPAATLTPHFQFEYVIMYANHTVERSSGFSGELFLA